MDINQFVLQQAADALQEVGDARKEAIQPYEEATITFLCQSLHARVLAADQELDQQLCLAIPITAVYAGQHASEAHRHPRVADLLKSSCSLAHEVIEAAETLDSEREVKSSDEAWKRFKRAVKMLDLAKQGLHALVAQSSSEDAQALHSTERTSDQELGTVQGSIVSSERYLRRRSPHEDKRKAVLLTHLLTDKELSFVTVEKLMVPFQRFLLTKKPLYDGVQSQDEPELGVNSDFDQMNAVWHSLLAAGRIDRRNADTYKKIYLALTKTEAIQKTKKAPHDVDLLRNPVGMAKGLYTLDIFLGIIYQDDPFTVVWPLGKSPTDEKRNVVIYCCAIAPRRYRYEGVKLLKIGQKPVRPPGADHAFSDILALSWDERRYLAMDNIDRLGAFAPKFLRSILAMSNQTSSAWKAFPFLRLPSELRNKVYEEYLSYDDGHSDWTRQKIQSFGHVTVPELCQVSHQLLSEVLPMYLETRTLAVKATQPLRYMQLGRQPLLRPMMRFSKIELRIDGRRFINIRITDKQPLPEVRYDGPWKFSGPWQPSEILYRPDQFEALIKMLKEDATVTGFGFAEIAAISNFLCSDKRRKMQQLRIAQSTVRNT